MIRRKGDVGVVLARGLRRQRTRWTRRDRLPLFSSAWHSCHSPISAKLNSLTGSWSASRKGGGGFRDRRGPEVSVWVWGVSALINELVVCRWYSASLLPLLQAPSSPFDMVMAPNWWRHFTHWLTTSTGEPHKASPRLPPTSPAHINHGKDPPLCPLGVAEAKGCLIS